MKEINSDFNEIIDKPNQTKLSQETKVATYRYTKPQLIRFGDVRDVTLGGSIPGGESLGNCIIGLEPGCN